MQKCLATGSRYICQHALYQARDWAIERIRAQDLILIGDAIGIDKAILDVCNQQSYKNIWVFGYDSKMHRKTFYGKNFPIAGSPLKRNRVMLGFRPDNCTAFWDGKSTGTKYTFQHARAQNIKVIVFDYSLTEKQIQ